MPRHPVIPDDAVPTASARAFQHALATYASETNKVADVWRRFADDDLAYRPHPRSTAVGDVFRQQLLSERRFFGEFLGLAEPPAADVLPGVITVGAAVDRLTALATARLGPLARADEAWWLASVRFFDVERERAWVFWRRVLHTAHHRTQLTVYLRMLGRPVPAMYGPSGDETWDGADPTTSVDAAARR